MEVFRGSESPSLDELGLGERGQEWSLKFTKPAKHPETVDFEFLSREFGRMKFIDHKGRV